ncbi:MAG TPA: hypothetical protein VJY37_02215 [Anaerovoracaceae bacterium]|nr:hypothetical protein [Anaerovoracaceae bacterium]
MGADDYISKPFNPLEVVARVKALLRRTGNRDAKKSPAEIWKWIQKDMYLSNEVSRYI